VKRLLMIIHMMTKAINYGVAGKGVAEGVEAKLKEKNYERTN